jgi:hypothetical protein
MIERRAIPTLVWGFFLLTAGGVFGQVSVGVRQWLVLDSNTFQNYEEISDLVWQPEFNISYTSAADKRRVRLEYAGSLFLFRDFSERRFQVHEIAVHGDHLMGDGTAILSWQAGASKRMNDAVYSYYDFNRIESYLIWEKEDSGYNIWRTGSRFRYQDYLEIPEFSYCEMTAFLQRDVFLKSRTTLILRFEAGYKRFTRSQINAGELEDLFDTDQPGNGWGRGKGKGNKPVVPEDSTVAQPVQVNEGTEGVLQWAGRIRVAQSLFRRTGLAAEFSLHRNPSGLGRVLYGQDSGYEGVEDIFDDPYTYERDAGRVELNQVIPGLGQFRVGWEIAEKRYVRSVSSVEEGVAGVSRRDTQNQLDVAWTGSFRFFKSLQFTLQYIFLQNRSNDPYYDFSDRVGSLSLNFIF